jgi:GNAT superfamily N-acetyltransferase
VRVEPLSPSNAVAWARLFESSGCTCFCRYWHFTGTRNEWLERIFHEPEKNREEQMAVVLAQAPEAGGLVALDEDEAIGWMKLVPRGAVPKLTSRGAYRSLALGPDPSVLSIGCFLVHPAHRRSGVARALLLAAEDHARSLPGVRVLEAYPHRVPHALHDEEAMMGPLGLFLSCGYEQALPDGTSPALPGRGHHKTEEAAPYPILRKRL